MLHIAEAHTILDRSLMAVHYKVPIVSLQLQLPRLRVALKGIRLMDLGACIFIFLCLFKLLFNLIITIRLSLKRSIIL